MYLETNRLIIRSATPEQSHAVASFYGRNKEFFADSQPSRDDSFFTSEHWQSNLSSLKAGFENDSIYQFYLYEKTDKEQVIGQVGFSGIQKGPFQACFLGYQLDEVKNGHGLMHEALAALINWLFQEKGLHRIMANYVPTNAKSAAVLKKLDFVVEGFARDYLYLNGEWKDHILTALTNRNFSF